MPDDVSPTILLIDDGAAAHVRRLGEVISREFPDARIVLGEDAESGYRLAHELPPDAAVIDIRLSGRDGIGLCRRLKLDPHHTGFPILLIIAQDAPEALIIEGLESGADAFLQYPFEPALLAAQLQGLLKIKQQGDQLRTTNRTLAALAEERARALHQHVQQCQALMESVEELVFLIELPIPPATGKLLDVNDAACRWTGYARAELLQMTMWQLVPPEDIPQLLPRLRTLMEQQHTQVEAAALTRGGTRLSFRVTAHMVDGIPPRYLLVARPSPGPASVIAGEAARNRVVYEVNVPTGEIQWSGAVEEVLGLGAQEAERFGMEAWRKCLHPEDRSSATAAWDRAVDTVGEFQHQYRLRVGEHAYRHMEEVGIMLPDSSGRSARAIGTLREINGDDDREALMREAVRDHEQSNRLQSLGMLAGGIAHDFNNILAAIIGLTDLSLRELAEDSEIHTDLKEALQAAHRAKELVRQILQFTRQSGEEVGPVFLHLLAREAIKLMRASLPPSIQLVDSANVHSGAVLANPAKLHQVIMNLGTNAIHALRSKDGHVEIGVEDVDCGPGTLHAHPSIRPGPYVLLMVADNGIGMPPEVQARIFEPFYTTRPAGEGTGMGLAVVRSIVDECHGVILVQSRPNAGTKVQVYFPRVAIAANTGGAPAPQPTARGAGRVLFVDDEITVRRFVHKALPRLGYEVTICEDGDEALDLFLQTPDAFDVLVTDQIMPRLNGDLLAQQVHQQRPSLPIILFTGYHQELPPERMREVGIREVIPKPVALRELAEALQRALHPMEAPGASTQRH